MSELYKIPDLEEMTDSEKISYLLSNFPLYKKVEITNSNYALPSAFEDQKFSFFCPNEKSFQTFKLQLEPSEFINKFTADLDGFQFNQLFDFVNQETFKYDLAQHYSGCCQYCKKYKINFLIKIDGIERTENLLIQKIGQYPPYQISPDKDLIAYLNNEDKSNYKKALICLSQNYGIGAYSYLRRIVENEIIKMIQDISELDNPESNKIKELLTEYDKNHQMLTLIDGIQKYLPSTLKSLGNNPLKVLHSQLSGGIHEFSEEECFTKAEHINTLLKFVIKKINEEESDIKAVRNAMNNLK